MKVLVVEDSERLRHSLGQGLHRAGFTVDAAADGREGLAFARCYDYDVVVLDLMLSGIDVLRTLRREDNGVHVLMLSAKDRVEDRIQGLETGADDYLGKPFSFDELCARLRALVRRRYQAKNPRIRLGSVEIDTVAKTVCKNGRPEHLTPGEYALLEYLALRRGRVTSQQQLVDHLYHSEAEISSNVIEVLVSGLRKKIHTPGEPPIVCTRRGHGYVID